MLNEGVTKGVDKLSRMWGLAFGAVLSMGAFAASAQVTGIVTSRTVDSTSTDAPHVVGSVDDGAGQFFTPVYSGLPLAYNNYNSYQVSTVVEPNYVAFANNATIAGGAKSSSITSSTSIAVTFTNTTGSSITPTLDFYHPARRFRFSMQVISPTIRR